MRASELYGGFGVSPLRVFRSGSRVARGSSSAGQSRGTEGRLDERDEARIASAQDGAFEEAVRRGEEAAARSCEGRWIGTGVADAACCGGCDARGVATRWRAVHGLWSGRQAMFGASLTAARSRAALCVGRRVDDWQFAAAVPRAQFARGERSTREEVHARGEVSYANGALGHGEREDHARIGCTRLGCTFNARIEAVILSCTRGAWALYRPALAQVSTCGATPKTRATTRPRVRRGRLRRGRALGRRARLWRSFRSCRR